MMECDEIKEIILKIISNDIIRRELTEISDDYTLGESGLGLNSMEFLKVMTLLEKKFNCQVEDEFWYYNKLHTIGDIVEYFYKNMERL